MQHCKSLCSLNSPVTHIFPPQHHTLKPKCPVPKPLYFTPKTLIFANQFTVFSNTHIGFSSRNGVYDDLQITHLPNEQKSGKIQENEELELQNKPSPVPPSTELGVELDSEPVKLTKDEALAPFLKFFKPRGPLEEDGESEGELEMSDVGDKGEEEEEEEDEAKKLTVGYYEPKPGDFVVGVVVSGNENKLDVNIGADLLGSMLTKEVLPLYEKDLEYLLCDLKNPEEFLVRGKMGIVKPDSLESRKNIPGRPVVDIGTVLFAEVLGKTLSGRPLLSSRRLFRRYSWHRVRQLKELQQPIEVKITEWNTRGLVTRIEGLRAFLPREELVNRVYNFTALKANVGRRMYVQITLIEEDRNNLVLSEREAWETLYLQEGTVLDGTVTRIFPYGAQILIDGTGRSGLLHISMMSRVRITSVNNLLAVGEKVKVMVLKSRSPNKIHFSIKNLESKPGLFVSNKEKVFSEAEEMAEKYRKTLPNILRKYKLDSLPANHLPFDNEANLYANWRWFKFGKR